MLTSLAVVIGPAHGLPPYKTERSVTMIGLDDPVMLKPGNVLVRIPVTITGFAVVSAKDTSAAEDIVLNELEDSVGSFSVFISCFCIRHFHYLA